VSATAPVPAPETSAEPLVRVRGLKKHFPITRGIIIQRKVGQVHAVDGIDLDIYPGQTVGLVGETGCGKSTTARLIARLLDVTEGTIEYEGKDITRLSRRRMRPLRREIAMIFQDPYASLNPRKTVGSIVGEAFQIHGLPGGERMRSPWVGRVARLVAPVIALGALVIAVVAGFSASIEVPLPLPFGLLGLAIVVEILRRLLVLPARRRWSRKVRTEVQRLMELVGLNPEHYNRFPHEFSGGQRQRIGVARALAMRPRLVICDEPVSALDVSIQAQILNLLEDLQEEFKLTYLFIAHDLSVVKHMSDSVMVMYLGRIVEIAPGETLYVNPKHPYTGALLSAVTIPDPELAAKKRRIILEGDVPSPIDPPSGCRFHPRCPRAQFPVCKEDDPRLTPHHKGQLAACHFPLEDRAVIESTA
jgi:peptide/nickel transport system ATP-binding protein